MKNSLNKLFGGDLQGSTCFSQKLLLRAYYVLGWYDTLPSRSLLVDRLSSHHRQTLQNKPITSPLHTEACLLWACSCAGNGTPQTRQDRGKHASPLWQHPLPRRPAGYGPQGDHSLTRRAGHATWPPRAGEAHSTATRFSRLASLVKESESLKEM